MGGKFRRFEWDQCSLPCRQEHAWELEAERSSFRDPFSYRAPLRPLVSPASLRVSQTPSGLGWSAQVHRLSHHFMAPHISVLVFLPLPSVGDMLVSIRLSFRDLLGCPEKAVCLSVSVSTRATGILKANTLTLKWHQTTANSRSSHLVAPLNGYMWTWDPEGIKRPKLRADIGKEHLVVILASEPLKESWGCPLKRCS